MLEKKAAHFRGWITKQRLRQSCIASSGDFHLSLPHGSVTLKLIAALFLLITLLWCTPAFARPPDLIVFDDFNDDSPAAIWRLHQAFERYGRIESVTTGFLVSSFENPPPTTDTVLELSFDATCTESAEFEVTVRAKNVPWNGGYWPSNGVDTQSLGNGETWNSRPVKITDDGTTVRVYFDNATDPARTIEDNRSNPDNIFSIRITQDSARITTSFIDNLQLRYIYPNNIPPDAPSNISPPADAPQKTLATLLSSSFSDPDGDSHAASHWLVRESTGTYASPVFNSGEDGGNLTSIQVPGLVPGVTYFWKVRHKDTSGGFSDFSQETSFRVGQLPNRPINLSPASGAVSQSLQPAFTSSPYTSVEPQTTHQASQWQLRSAWQTYGAPLYNSGVTGAYLTLLPAGITPTLYYGETFFWRVRYQDQIGNWSPWSVETSFTTDDGGITGQYLYNGCFDKGDLSGWTQVSGGGWVLDGSAGSPNSLKGTGAGTNVLRSVVFRLGDVLRGACWGDYDAALHPNRIELIDASTNTLLSPGFVAIPNANPHFKWDTSFHRNRPVYLRISQFASTNLWVDSLLLDDTPNLPRYNARYPLWIANGGFRDAPNPGGWTAPSWNEISGSTWRVSSEGTGNFVDHFAVSDLAGPGGTGVVESFPFTSGPNLTFRMKGFGPGRVELYDLRAESVIRTAIAPGSSSWSGVSWTGVPATLCKIRLIDEGGGWLATDDFSQTSAAQFQLQENPQDFHGYYDLFAGPHSGLRNNIGHTFTIDSNRWQWDVTGRFLPGNYDIATFSMTGGLLTVDAQKSNWGGPLKSAISSTAADVNSDYVEFDVFCGSSRGGTAKVEVGGVVVFMLQSWTFSYDGPMGLQGGANIKLIRQAGTDQFDLFYGNRFVSTITPSGLNLTLTADVKSSGSDGLARGAGVKLSNLRYMRSTDQRLVGTAILTNSFYGDPVNTQNGNFAHHEDDFVIPALGMPLAVTRTYNSASDYSGPFGRKWHSNVLMHIHEDGGRTYVIREDGEADAYADNGSQLTPEEDSGDTLLRDSDGYTLTRSDGTVYAFNTSGMRASVSDKNGNGLAMNYDTSERLISITDEAGRALNFAYDDTSGLITEVSDPLGRTMTYSYDGMARLVATTNAMAGLTQYVYDASHLMTGIIDAAGARVLTNRYDAEGRIYEQKDALGNLSTFAYDDANHKTTLTNPRGYAEQHSHTTEGWVETITDAMGESLSYQYDARGNRTHMVDKRGKSWDFLRDGDGNVSGLQPPLPQSPTDVVYDPVTNNPETRTDERGNTSNFSYDGSGNLSTVVDPLSNTEVFGYTPEGLIASFTDKNGNATQVEYNAFGQPEKIILPTDPGGADYIQMTCDDAGRVTAVRDPNGHVTGYTYDDNDRLTQVDLPDGTTRRFEYDAVGRVRFTYDGFDHAREFRYNPKGQLIESIDTLGNSTRYEYDENGNRTKVIRILDPGIPLESVTEYMYDKLDRVSSVKDANGNATSFVYDENGNVTEVHHADTGVVQNVYDDANRHISTTDAESNTTTFEYYPDGSLFSEVDPQLNRSEYTYDELGRLTRMDDPEGRWREYDYDPNGNLQTIRTPDPDNPPSGVREDLRTYDEANRLIRYEDNLGNLTAYEYDPAGKLTKKIDDPDGALRRETAYVYDAMNRVTEVTDHEGNTTHRTYDANGRLEKMTTPFGKETVYTYDWEGRLLQVQDANLNTIHYEYDALGRRTREYNDAGVDVQYAYDLVGNLTDVYGDRGSHTHFEYDAMNRVIARENGLGNRHEYAYDLNGNLATHKDARNFTTTYAYDSRDQLDFVTYNDGSTVDYAYDANGNLLTIADSLGDTLAYVYDALNRVTQHTAAGGRTIHYGYNANSNLAQMIYPSGLTVSYSYDALQRLYLLDTNLGASVQYGYDTVGRLASETRSNGTTTTYGYDSDSQLTSLNHQSPSGTIASYAYTFDDGGNITNIVENAAGPTNVPADSETYSNDLENRLEQRGPKSYAYDNNGNLTAMDDGSVTSDYTYDARNRLAGVTGLPEGDASFVYDAQGNRMQRVIGGVECNYVVDPMAGLPNVVAEYDDTGTLTAEYVYGAGLAMRVANGEAQQYHFNVPGSTVALSDNTGAAIQTYAYDEFGAPLGELDSSQPFQYVGKYGVMADADGLVFMRARYYLPEEGRFAAEDPIWTQNLYNYSGNVPISLIDPNGQSQTSDRIIGAALVGAGLGTFVGGAVTSWSGPGAIAGAGLGGILGGVAGLVGGTMGWTNDAIESHLGEPGNPDIVGSAYSVSKTNDNRVCYSDIEKMINKGVSPRDFAEAASTLNDAVTITQHAPMPGPLLNFPTVLFERATSVLSYFGMKSETVSTASTGSTGGLRYLQAARGTTYIPPSPTLSSNISPARAREAAYLAAGGKPSKKKKAVMGAYKVGGVDMFRAQLSESLLDRYQKYDIFSNGNNTPIIPEIVTERAVGGAYQEYEK